MTVQKTNPILILIALWLMVFSASSQVMIIAPILPQIGAALNIPEALQGTLITAYALSFCLLALIIGPISDRIGRRRILILGTGCMAVALYVHNFVFDYHSMLTVRAFAGAAGGLLSGASVAYVGDYYPYERRGWANGVLLTGMAAGQIVGIPLGTVLAEWGGFQQPFVLFAVIMLLAFGLTLAAVPQPIVRRMPVPLTFGTAGQCYRRLFREPGFAPIAGAFALASFGIAMYTVYLPTWITQKFNLDGYDIASVVFVGGLAIVITGPLAGKLSDRIGRKTIIIYSVIGLSIVMAVTTYFINEFWMAYPLFFITMMLVAARMGPFQALVSELVPDTQRGTLMSLSVAIGQLAMGIGASAAGYLFTDLGYASNSVLGAVAMLLLSILVWRLIPEMAPAKRPELPEMLALMNPPASLPEKRPPVRTAPKNLPALY